MPRICRLSAETQRLLGGLAAGEGGNVAGCVISFIRDECLERGQCFTDAASCTNGLETHVVDIA